MNIKKTYENYWQCHGAAPPERDSTVSERKALLKGELDMMSNGDNTRIFDAGCGTGEFTNFIYKEGFKVVGMDISETAIGRAAENHSGIDFRCGSLEDPLPFRDEEFDLIWSTELLEHIFDVHSVLSEFNRVLKPGGKLLLTVPYHGVIKNTAISLFGFERHYNPYLSHIRFFTKKSLSLCLGKAGFREVGNNGIGRKWPLYKSLFTSAVKECSPDEKVDTIG